MTRLLDYLTERGLSRSQRCLRSMDVAIAICVLWGAWAVIQGLLIEAGWM